MKDNSNQPRPGTGCPVEGEPEVVYETAQPYTVRAPDDGSFRIGRVHMDRSTTINSPFFWLSLGLLGGAAAVYLVMREKRGGR